MVGHTEMEGGVEYLSEWPPALQESGDNSCAVGAGRSSASSVEISPPPSKRPKGKRDNTY